MRFEKALNRAMHLYFRFARPMTLGVRAIALDGQERVLLVRHTYVSGWHLPGGGVESGETLLEALDRELREEGNVDFAGQPALHGVFFNRQASRRDHVAVYVVRPVVSLGPRAADREIAAAEFFSLDALPDETTRATRARLVELFENRPPDPYW
jgi:ADP-ribose pyrophosphatase YjhB (NUDIX family)